MKPLILTDMSGETVIVGSFAYIRPRRTMPKYNVATPGSVIFFNVPTGDSDHFEGEYIEVQQDINDIITALDEPRIRVDWLTNMPSNLMYPIQKE